AAQTLAPTATPLPSQVASPGPSLQPPSGIVVALPSATPGPGGVSGFVQALDDTDRLLTSALFGILKFAAILLTFALSILLTRRALRWIRAGEQLLVETLVNASGVVDLDRSVAGLSAILRELMIEQLRDLDRRLEAY